MRALFSRFALPALIALVLLSGCGGGGDDASTTATATPSPTATPAGFAIASAASESYDGRPAAIVAFTEPLAGAQKFDELAAIAGPNGEKVDGSWVLDDDNKRLRFPYLEANKKYTVTIKSALAAASGKTVGSDVQKIVDTGPLEPLLGFASQGSVLPAHETRGLPIVTVNVTDVDVEFLRVRDKDLTKFLASYTSNGRRSYWSLNELATFADSVYQNRFAIDATPNERTLTYLPVRDISELKTPGLYFAVMRRPGQFNSEFDTAMFFVSDIGLHVRAYKDKLVVHTASLETGEPKGSVEISVRDAKGDTVISATSDGEGLATLAYHPKAEHLLVATWGRDVSVLPFNQPALDLSEFAIAGRPQRAAEIFPWSSRDLFRPGETIHVSALLRDDDGKSLPATQPLFATLRQPDGRMVVQQQVSAGELGYYEFSREIPVDAPTGKWSVDFSTDPSKSDSAYGFVFRVEEFLPERLKLELDSNKERLAPGDALPLTVEAAYLYGAPAAGNRFTAKLAVSNDEHPVESHADFYFGDALAELPKDPQDAIDDVLDDDGKLAQDIPILADTTVTTPVDVVISGSVFETGGRAVSRTLHRTVWPAEQLVGVRPLFDMKDGAPPTDNARFEVIRVDADGNELAAPDLAVKLIRERRDYHWSYAADTGWKFEYVQRFETAGEQKLALEAGKRGTVSFPVEWGSYRLEVTDPETKLVMRLPFEAGWGWDDNQGQEARPDKVKLALDKTSYKGGDTIKVTLTPPHEGPALLMLEGDSLLWHKSIPVRAGTVVEIPLDPKWERHDLYLTALVFRPGSSSDRITPKRAVGIAHVPIERGDRNVDVSVELPEMMRPLNDLVVNVKAPKLAGQTARVRVTAVDLGVLNITNFPIPDAAAWFFAQRALGIDAYDLYGRVIESLEGNRARLRFGGDAALMSLPGGRRPNAEVQIVDLFAAPVALDAKGEAQLKLPVPDFNGTLRVRALVFSADKYGKGEKDVIVRAPLVVEASTPRIMAPRDESQITIDVQNLSGADDAFKVTLAAKGPVELMKTSAEVTLADGKRQTLTFPLRAKDLFGTAEVKATVTGGANPLERTFHVAVRPAWPAIRRSKATVINGSPSLVPDAGLLANLVPDSVNMQMSIGTLPPLPFTGVIRDLIVYPYGCIEQTTSKAMPLVMLDADTQQKLGVGDLYITGPNGEKVLVDAAKRKAMLDEAFSRITSMQTESGHFAMWPGDTYAVTYMTPYVAEMFITARDAGFQIPEATLNKALDRINEDLLGGGNTHYDYEYYEYLRLAEMAHGGYVLARVGRAPVGTLRSMYDNERGSFLSGLPLVHLGAALALAGDNERAGKAIEEAFTREFKRPDYVGDYGSRLRDLALMLALTHEHGLAKPEYDAKAYDIARELLGEVGEERRWYLSTQEEISIFRLGRSLVKDAPSSFAMSMTVGKSTEELTGRALYSRSFTPAEIAAGVRFVPSAQGSLYLTQDVGGVPRTAPTSDRDDLKITRQWYTTDGSEFTGDALAEGDVLVAAITVESSNAINDGLVVDLLPGGLEVENLNLTDASQWEGVEIEGVSLGDRSGAADIKHEEYRDDRYVAAISMYAGATAHLFYIVRAVSPGTFVVPPASIEDMYRPELRAYSVAKPERVKVVPPQVKAKADVASDASDEKDGEG